MVELSLSAAVVFGRDDDVCLRVISELDKFEFPGVMFSDLQHRPRKMLVTSELARYFIRVHYNTHGKITW